MAPFFLLPAPAWAALNFSQWFFSSTSPTVIGAQADSTGSAITFTPFTAGSGPFTVTGKSNVNANGSTQLIATFNNWNTIGGSGNGSFEVTYNGTDLTGLTGQTVSLSTLSNQFSGNTTNLVSGSKPIKFTINFLSGSSWSAPSSPVTLVFSAQ
jgi:hypothetical protein